MAAGRADQVSRSVLVFHVGRSTDDIHDPWEGVVIDADSPFTLTGDVDEMVAILQERRERWGLNYLVLLGEDRDTRPPVVQGLTGS